MSGTVCAVLPAQVRSVPAARRLVREALSETGAEHLRDQAVLAVSELATNAVVHAGAPFELRVAATAEGVRVEVRDDNPHVPTVRDYAPTAGTGRGLRLLQGTVDRWGADPTPGGKTVWFEIGRTPAAAEERQEPPEPARDEDPPAVGVTLLDVPLLMHWAWQEHAQSLLREFLLFAIDRDPTVLERHAEASEALTVLYEQVPRPELPDDPEALLAGTPDPGVTARELVVEVPAASVAHFSTLDAVLGSAVEAASTGQFLGPPTQPEIAEMRAWLCAEITGQAAGTDRPRAWRARTDVRTPVVESGTLLERHAALTGSAGDVLVADEASVIVAVSPTVAEFLGYADATELLGRRIIAVVPPRYHQAHIAGTTLHATNGRDKLLGVRLTVPMVRADGSEVPVQMRVRAQVLDGSRVFVADLVLPSAS